MRLFTVDAYLTTGRVVPYETDSPLYLAKYIRHMELDRADQIVTMMVTKSDNHENVYDQHYTTHVRGHRIESTGSYIVDTIMYYDVDNEDVWTLPELMEYYENNVEAQEEYPDFWKYLGACMTRNNGTLDII